MSEEDAWKYLVAQVVKTNFCGRSGKFFLKRDYRGILHPIDPNPKTVKDDEVLETTVGKVRELESLADLHTKTDFLKKSFGKWMGYGRVQLDRVIERAISEERGFLIPGKGKNRLRWSSFRSILQDLRGV